MKTLRSAIPPADLAGKVRQARLRLTNAQSKLAEAKEHSRLARQRRKAAKQAARAAKKEARLAKERVALAEAALARLKARQAKISRPPVKANPGKETVKKVAAAPRRKHPLKKAIILRSPAIAKIKNTAVRRRKPKPAARSIVGADIVFSTVLSELETSVEVLPPSEHKPTPQIVKGVEEIFTENTDTQDDLAPDVETVTSPGQPAELSTINS